MKKRINSFEYAWNGIRTVFLSEINFKIHCISGVIVVLIGLILKISSIEWSLILFLIGTILSLEMVNTSIEILCDRVCSEYNPQVKKIKDIAGGAVLIMAIISMVIGCLIFVPKIMELW